MKSSFRATLYGAGLGVLGSLPLFACGLALETRRDWAWVRAAQARTERAVLKLFGSKRQVSLTVPIGTPAVVGCLAFRGTRALAAVKEQGRRFCSGSHVFSRDRTNNQQDAIRLLSIAEA